MPAVKRVLIVSPHFPPVNKPDLQRVRMSLPYYAEFGWHPHVLTVHPDDVAGAKDELLAASIPEDIPITRVRAVSRSMTRYVGLGSLAFRSMRAFNRAAEELFEKEEFSAVFFSTTEFAAMTLGRKWKKRYGLPYILDFQDPWVNTYYFENKITPPGGYLKYYLMHRLARFMEPYAVRRASQIISVSPSYPEMLRQRYKYLSVDQFSVIPFGVSDRDFQMAGNLKAENGIYDPDDGRIHLVYTGAGGRIMHHALKILFGGLANAVKADPGLKDKVHLYFIGTSYAAPDRSERTIDPVAREMGVAEMVTEIPDRVPYFQSLQLMREAHAVMLIGSDNPGYAASKLYPCLMSGRPVLAIVHEKSPVNKALERCGGGRCVPFDPSQSSDSTASAAEEALRWVLDQRRDESPEIDRDELEKFSARTLTGKQCEVFDRAISHNQ